MPSGHSRSGRRGPARVIETRLVFQRRHSAAGFTDGFVEYARAQLQIEQFDEEFTDARNRQPGV